MWRWSTKSSMSVNDGFQNSTNFIQCSMDNHSKVTEKFNIEVVAKLVSIAHIKCTYFKSSNHTIGTQRLSNIFGRFFKCTPLCLLTSKSNLFIDRANKRIDLNCTRIWVRMDTRTHQGERKRNRHTNAPYEFRVDANGSIPTLYYTDMSNESTR